MIPSLPGVDSSVAGRAVHVPPPPRFRAPEGEICNVWLDTGGEYAKAKGTSAAQKSGLAFESRVQRALKARWDGDYHVGPRLHFSDDSGDRFCIPDGILLRGGRALLVEVKSQHMPEAWWQLRQLYQPVLQQRYREVSVLEICRIYDPHTPFPETVMLVIDLEDATHLVPRNFGVMPWRM